MISQTNLTFNVFIRFCDVVQRKIVLYSAFCARITVSKCIEKAQHAEMCQNDFVNGHWCLSYVYTIYLRGYLVFYVCSQKSFIHDVLCFHYLNKYVYLFYYVQGFGNKNISSAWSEFHREQKRVRPGNFLTLDVHQILISGPISDKCFSQLFIIS